MTETSHRATGGPNISRRDSRNARKGDMVLDLEAASIEFIGTVVFLTIPYGAVQALSLMNAGNDPQTYMYIAAAFGLSLIASSWLFYRATGGLFNPAVSLALLLVRAISVRRFALYVIAQIVGAIAAAAIVQALTEGDIAYTTNLIGLNKAQGVFLEMFVTAFLILTVLMLAAEKHKATPFAPLGIGLIYFACLLFATKFTGGSLNPARSFGPEVLDGFHGYHWIYWVGPLAGSLLATAVYHWLRFTNYWELSHDSQDGQYSGHGTTGAGLNRSGDRLLPNEGTGHGVPLGEKSGTTGHLGRRDDRIPDLETGVGHQAHPQAGHHV